MIKLLATYIFIFFISFNGDLSKIRNSYKEAVKSKEKTFVLNSELEHIKKTQDKRLVAYKGAVISLTARYLKGAKQKKVRFKEGVLLIEFALQQMPNNVEIRFIRLSVQQNSPKFLGYHKEIDMDKNYILNQFHTIKSAELKAYLKSYIMASNNFSEEEKNSIR